MSTSFLQDKSPSSSHILSITFSSVSVTSSNPVRFSSSNNPFNINCLASRVNGPIPNEPSAFLYTEPLRLLLSLNLLSFLIAKRLFLKSLSSVNICTSSPDEWLIKFCKDLSSLTIVQHQQPKRELPVTGILSLSTSPRTLFSSPKFSPWYKLNKYFISVFQGLLQSSFNKNSHTKSFGISVIGLYTYALGISLCILRSLPSISLEVIVLYLVKLSPFLTPSSMMISPSFLMRSFTNLFIGIILSLSVHHLNPGGSGVGYPNPITLLQNVCSGSGYIICASIGKSSWFLSAAVLMLFEDECI